MIEKSIATGTHGRYLVAPASVPGAPLLIGFHGYGEGADAQLERLRAMPHADRWTILSVQGLSRFYHRQRDIVVASWMTRQDRALAIADNLVYVAAIVSAESPKSAAEVASARPAGVVFAGFSQGVAMAFRAACAAPHPAAVIAVGGDVPPELERPSLARLGPVLLCRGARDRLYSSATFEHDRARLGDAALDVTAIEFDCGHEWSDGVIGAASAFLDERFR